MKKLLFLTFCALILNVASFAQKKEMSVKDYFLAIPTEFIKAESKKRAAWIESENAEDGNLTYNIPISELTDEEGDGKVFGGLQVFKKKDGGVLLGMVNNLCADGECIGMMRFLDYKAGNFTDVSDDYLIIPDNDEVIKILRSAPAFEDKKSLKDGVQVPLAIEFYGGEKSVHFLAGCKTSTDGGVVAKMYKWNGEAFIEFEYEESPE
ncbi:MAG: hypothetical protein LUM44_23720 [Pyrinomonadaceae bacterium]|nr:hypothetical protein [Pyrinomonadaceae bacterium]